MKLCLFLSFLLLCSAPPVVSGLDRNLHKSMSGSKSLKGYGGTKHKKCKKGMGCKKKMMMHKGMKGHPSQPTRAPHRPQSPTPAPHGPPVPPTTPTPAPAGPSTAQSVACNDAKDFNGHKYLYQDNNTFWEEADAFAKNFTCCNAPGHLVTITSLSEENFVATLLTGTDSDGNPTYYSAWIGLHPGTIVDPTNADYNWSNGEVYNPTVYTAFVDGVPGPAWVGDTAIYGVCINWENSTTVWNNGILSCFAMRGFVVEFNCTSRA